jgi:hypothetical protein
MGDSPSQSALAAAPHLSHWDWTMTATGPCLRGVVTGHRWESDGEIFTTGRVVAAAPDASWVRTADGFFRLGIPGGTVDG